MLEATKENLRATMQRSKNEAAAMPGNKWVVVTNDGGTPLRESNDKGHIAFYGDRIFSTTTRIKAARVAAEFNSKLEAKGSETRLFVLLSSVWKEAHIKFMDEVLNDLLK